MQMTVKLSQLPPLQAVMVMNGGKAKTTRSTGGSLLSPLPM